MEIKDLSVAAEITFIKQLKDVLGEVTIAAKHSGQILGVLNGLDDLANSLEIKENALTEFRNILVEADKMAENIPENATIVEEVPDIP